MNAIKWKSCERKRKKEAGVTFQCAFAPSNDMFCSFNAITLILLFVRSTEPLK